VDGREHVGGTLVLQVHEPAEDRAIRNLARSQGAHVRVLVYAHNASLVAERPIAGYVWNGDVLIREF